MEKADHKDSQDENPFLGFPRYKVILADPPWNFATWSHRGEGKGAAQHYKCMTLEDICSLPVSDIAMDDAALFLWVVQPMLPEALRVIEAWGFKFRTVAFAWVKMPSSWADNQLSFAPRIKPKMGLGYHTRSGMEQCWLAIRGKGYKRQEQGVEQVIHYPIGRHSEKPQEVIKRIERLVGDVPRIELFARCKCNGWDSWGDEI